MNSLPQPPEFGANHLLAIGPWVLNCHTNQLLQGDQPIALEHRHTMLLQYFALRPNLILTKSELIAAIWPNKVVNDESLAVSVSQLRRLLGDDARIPRYIKTIPGVGYQFIAAPPAALPLHPPFEPDVEPVPAPHNSPPPNIPPTKRQRFAFTFKAVAGLALVIGITLYSLSPVGFLRSVDPLSRASNPKANPDTNSLRSQLQAPSPTAAPLQEDALNNWRLAIKKGRQLLEQDPTNATAYLNIAEAKMKLLGDKVVAEENYPEILGLLQKSLELNPTLAHAHLWLGHLLTWHDHNFKVAETHFQQSLKLSPQDPIIHDHYTHFLLVQKRFNDARSQLGNLRQLDPLSFSATNLAWLYLLEGEYQNAAKELERIARTEEGDEFFHQAAQNVYFHLGDEPKAYEHLRWFYSRAGFSPEKVSFLDQKFADAGLRAVYRWLLETKEPAELGQFTPPISWARYATAAGEHKLALVYLEQAFKAKQFHTECTAADPFYMPLYEEKRFQQLSLLVKGG